MIGKENSILRGVLVRFGDVNYDECDLKRTTAKEAKCSGKIGPGADWKRPPEESG